jgi:restriction system protein
MSRRISVLSIVRAAARASRAAQANQRRALNAAIASQRATARAVEQRQAANRRSQLQSERDRAKADKQAKAQHIEAQIEEARLLSDELRDRRAELSNILAKTTKPIEDQIFASLEVPDDGGVFSPPTNLRDSSPKPSVDQFEAAVPSLTFTQKLIPGASTKHKQKLEAAREAFDVALSHWKSSEDARKRELLQLYRVYEASKAASDAKRCQQNAELKLLHEQYIAGIGDAIESYHEFVLDASDLPEECEGSSRIAYVPGSKQLVIERHLPTLDAVPTIEEYRYTKAKDEISPKARKQAEVIDQYQDVVCAITLRTVAEAMMADARRWIDVICFNGYIETVDGATGQGIRPCLISLRTTRAEFERLNLERVDKKVCLRNLGAQVSPRPAEAQAVKPIVEFDMVDKRFVEQSDVIGGLESRPNLMELTPYQFEGLVANLFGKLGLETKLTRSTKDGGVDCVAFDARPVLGGKVVIQAKRYRHTVGVSAVRDLYGTMMNEGANKGILVTTSGYGPDAFEFCKDKPIELIDGGGLLYLLNQTGVAARIVMPAE